VTVLKYSFIFLNDHPDSRVILAINNLSANAAHTTLCTRIISDDVAVPYFHLSVVFWNRDEQKVPKKLKRKEKIN
jgi:hypothetical protein